MTQQEARPRFESVPTAASDSPPKFAHPSEKEFAQILDFYGLRWSYEPYSFPLRWDGDAIAEMLTPDFYLHDLDLYLELTTMKQSLVTQKNRKIRRIREIYPDINIRLLYRKDFHRLLAKFGFGPLAESGVPGINKVLLSDGQVQQKVDELGKALSKDYAQKQPVLVGVQRGMVCFMADLMRKITLPVMMDFMSISHYRGADGAGLRITKDLDIDLYGHDVVLVEDIVDTGMTLNYLLGHLRSKGAASVEVCTLLDKRARRIVDVPIKYVGFEVPDEFLVGYGLDYQEKYRNLPFIGVLRPEGG
ncbi:MAG: hypoxanthine phosphoribosyltransferase [SAR202 cluster bacterium]|jgi:hypoxanthine phosphoribosyltransferase|nr:hypoxanthine phosphoribosyltransferase [SAR202 cluster bacterium]MDP7103785.1 hypoxanthine phosphoribosyltransferase [SAR202 cluster bacterium]MDP7225299.1 hypoxanthine phosphoribosyltransferase [SAR202 cluster bacterium]MDP7413566.1 hypoxanthine phosphoribosyltransferase [SAR202 cluster bacterium]MDP7534761.1 hypoxanthine phosphoribosyltransferase [SAR202 cluster bacterium]|tara:strand:+ start:35 stop:946 length:912 start_codon:yes stop_codon:yes gene_type:complete